MTINGNANNLQPMPVPDYKAAGDALARDYDCIVADFRYYKPPLAEICARLKPSGKFIVASMEENVFAADQDTANAFERSRLALPENLACWYSACEAKSGAAEQPASSDLMAVAHIFQETINKHQFTVSNVTVWKKSADFQAASAEVGKATDHTVF